MPRKYWRARKWLIDFIYRTRIKNFIKVGVADEESDLGWFIEPTARGIQIEKGGNPPRHSSECVFIRKKNIDIICFTNMQGEDLGNLAENVLDKVLAAK